MALVSLRQSSVAAWGLALALAFGLAALIPPLQSPDEIGHLHRAYMISQGQLLLSPMPAQAHSEEPPPGLGDFMAQVCRSGGSTGGMVDEALLRFGAAHLALVRDAGFRYSEQQRQALDQLAWSGSSRFCVAPGAGYYFPAVYAPQAAGLAIGRGLGLGVSHSYWLARGLTLLACLGILWLAFGRCTPNPLALALLLLPMTVFQLLSPTIDGLTTALSVLALSLFVQSADRGRSHTAGASWSLAACIFVLATSRTHLLPLLALPFFLCWRRRSPRDFWLGLATATGALAWTLFALHSSSDTRVLRAHTTAQLLAHYAADPLAYGRLVMASLADRELSSFYQQSFIGILGWLDTRLPAYAYPTLWSGLGLSALASFSLQSLRQDWSARLLLLALALASAALVFLALLVTWTPHPAALVQGVQGRYFIVPALLVAYAAGGFSVTRKGSPRAQWSAVAVAAFALCALGALTLTLIRRYH